MRTFMLRLCCWLLILWQFPANAVQTANPVQLYSGQQPVVALVNAHVITAPGEHLKNATVVIENGFIKRVQRGRHIPQGARVIDMSGRWIYPGFIDPYSSFGVAAVNYQHTSITAPVYRASTAGAGAHNDAIHAAMNWSQHILSDRSANEAQQYWQQGFTAVQTAQLDGIFQGSAATISVGPGEPGDIVYQPKASAFLGLDKGSSQQSYPSSLMGAMALLRQTLSDAKWYQQAAGKKTITGQQTEVNADLAALTHIDEQGAVITGGDEHMLLRLQRLVKPFGVPLAVVGNDYEYARVDAVKKSGATVIMPLSLPAAPPVDDDVLRPQISLASMRHWERAATNPAILAEHSVPFAFTLHNSDPAHVWQTLRSYVAQGLSEKDALTALTTTPAKLAGVAEQAGKIANGYRADLVIADGDLFKQGRVVSVFLRGQRQAVIAPNILRIEGHYQLSWQSKNAQLSITAKPGAAQPQLKLRYNGQQLALGPVHMLANALSVRVDLTPWLADGQGRLTLQSDDLGMHAKLWLPNGIERQLAVSKQSAPSRAQPPRAGLVSHLTYPDTAYGLKNLPQQASLVIKNVTLWTSESEGIIDHADVQIADGKIEKIGHQLSVPNGYQELDGTGKHLTAGIIDEHSHIAIKGRVNEGSDAITSEVRISDVINPDDIAIYRALAGGVTTAQLLHGSANPIGGQSQIIKMRWGEDALGLQFKAAPPTIKFALGENVKQSNWGERFTKRYPQSRAGVVALYDNAFTAANNYRKKQQAYQQLSRSERAKTAPVRKDYRLAALVEVLEHKRFIHIHSYVASEILAMMRVADRHDFAVQTFTHVLEGYKVAKELVAHHASASTFADWWDYKFEAYDAIASNTCLMMRQGVLTSINSDSNDLQRRLNQEAAKSMYYCGMPPAEAWKMATINPAKQLKIDQYVGSVKVGKQADLVLWDHNPLSTQARVIDTWIDGRRYYNRQQEQKAEVEARQERQQLIQKILATDKRGGRLQNAYQPKASIWEAHTSVHQQEKAQ